MDLINLAVFGLALTLGVVQQVLDRDQSATAATAARRWWANAVLFAAHTSAVTLFAAAIAWLTRGDAAATTIGIAGWPVAAQIAVLLAGHSLVQYWLHRAGHAWPILWRLHRIHHTDTALDATTGLRHHPLESMVDYIPVLGLTVILGPSAAAMLGFFLLATGFALFTHVNPAWLPARLDKALSGVIMTPRLHRLHHSTWQPETDTNYGNILVIWDRIFGTYLPAPDSARAGFALGLDGVAPAAVQDPFGLIAAPFVPTQASTAPQD